MKLKEQSFDQYVSGTKPFGLPTNYSSGSRQKKLDSDLRVFGRNREKSFVGKDKIIQNRQLIDGYKLFMPRAYGERIPNNLFVLGKPFIGMKNDICTETYIVIGTFPSLEEAENVSSYICTKFFRFLVLLHKPAQDTLRITYSFVPVQDFSEPWTDEKLYAKYGLTDDEIAFIESMIRPMELNGGGD